MAQLKLWKEIVVFAPLPLPRFGLRLRAQENEPLIAPFAASSSSGKSNGVVAANVMCNAADYGALALTITTKTNCTSLLCNEIS